MNKNITGKSIPDMYGVVVHANIIDMIINKKFMWEVSVFWTGVFSFLFLFFGNMYYLWLEERREISFLTIKKITLFLFTIILMWLALWLFKLGIVFRTSVIIAVVLLGCNLILYYKYFIRLIQKHFRWKSYF